MRIAIAVAVALMAANHVSLVQAGERSDRETEIYDLVMDWVGDYGQLNEPKVMAICIDWDAPTASGFRIHNAFTTYTGITSDRPIFASELARNSKSRCKSWAKAENIDCTCQMLDSNGQNVLKVPARK